MIEELSLASSLAWSHRSVGLAWQHRIGLVTMVRRKAPRIPDAPPDQLLAGADPKTTFDSNGLLDDLEKALANRDLNAE